MFLPNIKILSMKSNIKQKTTKSVTGTESLVRLKKKGGITAYEMQGNGMRVLYMHRPHTGVVTSNILYKVGSRDEECGETGVAHMLEHMLFKPTKQDLKKKIDSGAMHFEREMGIVLNANTWKDRTTYYFSYPKEHFVRALKIEAERMRDVVLSDAEFLPERTNVLSEFDMYAGDEEFALSVQMAGAAFQSHPYGHETIGYREDIEGYTTEMLDAFYKKYYAPNNATLIIVGDVDEKTMCEAVVKIFGHIKPSTTITPRKHIREPKQEGVRTVVIERPSTTNMLAIGVRHEGFPSTAWYESMVALNVLAGGKDSILYKTLVDTSIASSVHISMEPTSDANLGILFIMLAPEVTHDDVYARVRACIDGLTVRDITPYLKKIIAQSLTSEYMSRENSLGIVAELVEYESAGAWESYADTEAILSAITAKDIQKRIQAMFAEQGITLGKYIGKK